MIDLSLIKQIQQLLKKFDISISTDDLYNNLLDADVINEDGTPTQKALQTGVVRSNGNQNTGLFRAFLVSRLSKLERQYKLTSLNKIDPILLNNVLDNNSAKVTQQFVSRAVIDSDIQLTHHSFRKLLLEIIKQRLYYLDQLIMSGDFYKYGESVLNQYAELAEHCEHDVRTKYPIDYDISDWSALLTYIQWLTFEAKDSINSRFLTAHKKYIERNYCKQSEMYGLSSDDTLDNLQSQMKFANDSFHQYQRIISDSDNRRE